MTDNNKTYLLAFYDQEFINAADQIDTIKQFLPALMQKLGKTHIASVIFHLVCQEADKYGIKYTPKN